VVVIPNFDVSRQQLAEELYKAMTKKFKHSWQIWLRYSQFHLKNLHSIEGARKVLERALQVLPKKKRTCPIFLCALAITKCHRSALSCADIGSDDDGDGGVTTQTLE
jgi:hypothetical protein